MTGGGQLGIVRVFAEIFAAGLQEGDDGLGDGAGVVHHVRDRLTDDVVKRQQDEERNERPQAAAAHGHAFFLVHLLDGQLVFLLVVAVFGLKGLDLRRQTGHLEHTLLALDRHRQQHQLDDQRKQDQRQTVAVGEGIQPVEQIAERDADDVGQTCGVLGFCRSLLGSGFGAQSLCLRVSGLGGVVVGDACRQRQHHQNRQQQGEESFHVESSNWWGCRGRRSFSYGTGSK